MIAAGTVLTVRFAGQGPTGFTVDDLGSALADQLAQDTPALQVLTSKFETPDILSSVLSGQILHYVYSAVLVVKVLTAAPDVDTVVNQIMDDVAVLTGDRPAASVGTMGGTADPTLPADTGLFGPLASVANALDTDVKMVLWGGIALVALVVVVVAYGPNVTKLARVQL